MLDYGEEEDSSFQETAVQKLTSEGGNQIMNSRFFLELH